MVTLILTRIVFVLSIPLCLYAVYFGVVALFGLRKKLPAAPQAKPEKRFALVVAARNEAAVIGHLVDSLYGQDYPRELYEVIVAPNNCTDDTEAVAAGRGARIFCPEGVIRSKGEVLTQVVDKIVLAEEFDAMCVFDADNLVDGQFLARMNDALVSGAQVAQGFRDSKNPEQSAISGCYSICYWMLNRFYNGARSALHLSALVNGSGFAVTTALLRRLGGWHTVTMTEDYEFSAQCAMLGERVHFVPEALIYDEQPLTFRQSWKQRRRWTTGSLQGLQNYGHGLFSSFVLHGSLICLDMYLTFLVPMVQLASVVLGIAGLVLTLLGSGITFGGIMLHGMMLAALMTAGGFVASVVGSAVFAAFTVALKNESLSGMAKGIDGAAMKGALRAGGFTAAVLGGGVDVVYPAENRRIYEDVAATGVVLSEYPPGTEPMASHFPVRNRILSGLSLAAVVVEAPERSGALITASTALEQGREVFAVPGPINAPNSKGCNALIRDGAGLVSEAWDILSFYEGRFPHKLRRLRAALPDLPKGTDAPETKPVPIPEKQETPRLPVLDVSHGPDGLTDDQLSLLRVLPTDQALLADDAALQTDIPIRRVLSALTMLEIDGYVRRQGAGSFLRTVELKEE